MADSSRPRPPKIQGLGDNRLLRWPDPPPDLEGKTCIVTGANGGTGYETALYFGRRGAKVVLACRSAQRAQDALERMKAAAPDGSFEVASLDLASLDSVRAFASTWSERSDTAIDFLINNAGLTMSERVTTKDGFEMTYQTNALSPFLLSVLLLPHLRKSSAPRVVFLSSKAGYNQGADVSPANFNAQDMPAVWKWPSKFWTGYRVYSRSKMLDILLAVELQRRAPELGVNIVHPGFVNSGLGFGFLIRLTMWLFARTPEQGAMTTIFAACSEEKGQMWGDCRVVELPDLASDSALLEAVWEACAKDAGLPDALKSS